MATANPLDPSGGPLPGVAGENPYAWFHDSGRSPPQQNPPSRLSCSNDPLQDDQTSHMFSAADCAEAPRSIWDPGPSVAGETSVVADNQRWSSTAGEGASSHKVRRRRGRPRLYEDDCIPDVPKRKLGRPLTYTPITGSFRSWSSMTSSTPNMSPGSADGSTAPSWEGPSPGRSARPAKRNQPADETTEQDPDEAAAQAVIRTRNKAAATRYHLKTQQAVDRMETAEREASLRRQALLACADQLRQEVNSLKTEVMQHANCGCPHISGYISAATQHALTAMAASPAPKAPVSPSAPQHLPVEVSPALAWPHLHLASCPWQQGGFVVDNPVPGLHYDATMPSAGLPARPLLM